MRKLILLSFFALTANLCNAQTATFVYNNLTGATTGVYYGATFHAVSISGNCPSTVASNFYMDIPNSPPGNSNTRDARDETSNIISSVTKITGISLWAMTSPGTGTGATYVIPFCVSGTPSLAGSQQIPENGFSGSPPTTVTWNINTGTYHLY